MLEEEYLIPQRKKELKKIVSFIEFKFISEQQKIDREN